MLLYFFFYVEFIMKINIDMMCVISSIMEKMDIDAGLMQKFFKMGDEARGKSKSEVERLQKQIGAELLLTLGKKLHLVKDELVQFISLYKEISEEEAKQVDVIEFLKEIAKDKGLKSFLQQKDMPESKKK